MKKKRTFLPREQFCTRFLHNLQSFHTADPVIALILKTPIRRDQCAALFWDCVSDAPARLAGISARRRRDWSARLETAIQGVDAIALIYRESGNPRKADFANFLQRAIKPDLLETQRKLPITFPPPQARGRNGRDWSAVLYAQRMLEGHLGGEQISDATLATLLDVAEEVAGTGKTVTKNAVRNGLARLKENLPQVESTLTKFYPRGEKFPEPPARTQLGQK